MSVNSGNSPDFYRKVDDWMAAARQGCQQSLGDLLTTCRDYLLLVAEKEIPCDLRAKVGASDVVQETLLAAQRNFVRFEGHEPEQLLRWLRAILILQLADLNRHYRHTLKRDVCASRLAKPRLKASRRPISIPPAALPFVPRPRRVLNRRWPVCRHAINV